MSEAETPANAQSLDDVLVAMDVVDTLRHRERIFLREMDTDGREDELVARLKDIYTAQGMDVPEATIRDGVRAMADNRFQHTPAKRGFFRRLAIIYITRDRWWKPAAGALAVLATVWGGWQFGVVGPREARADAARIELAETIPQELADTRDAVLDIAETEDGQARAEALYMRGIAQAARGEREAARATREDLAQLGREIAARYQVRVVSRDDEMSGVFLIPDNVPGGRNYYLIVEAVDATGAVLDVSIMDEVSQTEHTVNVWGQRVSQTVFDRVAADKRDDQIIQDSIIGEKLPGEWTVRYSVSTPGGAITEW